MTDLSNIQFYEVCKKRPLGEKKTKWVRRTHGYVKFEKKARIIRMRAEKINQKLKII